MAVQTVKRTYRYPLRPTAAQAATLESWRIACQQLYNGALQERRDAWRRCGVARSYYDQAKALTELRRDDPDWKAIPVGVARSALVRLDQAFKGFFRRVRAGEKPGYPRFKSRDRYGSFSIGRDFRYGNGLISVPKLGPMRYHEYRPLKGTVLDVQIKREGTKWFVCFAVDLGETPAKVAVSSAVGIDLGLTTFATMSNGDTIENPRYLRKSEERLAKAQRALSRKKRGSGRHQIAQRAVATVHLKIKSRRLDFVRKVAAGLFEKYCLIAHENLNIHGMAMGHCSKSIHDAGWGLFIGALTCKAESAGKWLVPVNPRGTTQRCSQCGVAVAKTLDERVHSCTCGCVLGRDHNAALNILALAAVPGAPGELTLVDSGSAGRNEKPAGQEP